MISKTPANKASPKITGIMHTQMKGEVKGGKEVANKKTNQTAK